MSSNGILCVLYDSLILLPNQIQIMDSIPAFTEWRTWRYPLAIYTSKFFLKRNKKKRVCTYILHAYIWALDMLVESCVNIYKYVCGESYDFRQIFSV